MLRGGVLFLLMSLLVGCGSSLRKSELNGSGKTATVAVDPRIELISSLTLLSGQDLCQPKERDTTRYEREVLTRFASLRRAPILRMYRSLRNLGFACEIPPDMILHYSSPPELREIAPLPAALLEGFGGPANAEKFLSALRSFWKEGDLGQEFDSRRPFFEQLVGRATDSAARSLEMAPLESYFGVRNHSYALILMPLVHNEAYSIRVMRPDSTYEVYALLGYQESTMGEPAFGISASFRLLVRREFIHGFVDHLLDRYPERITQFASLFDRIAPSMMKQGYRGWREALREHVVRSVQVRLEFLEGGKEAGEEALRREKSLGFAYVEPLVAKLQEYERNRAAYPTFGDFVLKIFDVLLELSIQNQ